MADVLSDSDVSARLSSLAGWSGDSAGIRRTVSAPDFMTGIRIVEGAADAAEELQHHPDIDIRWTAVTFVLSTHSAGGVTEKDFELARRIDAVAARHDAT